MAAAIAQTIGMALLILAAYWLPGAALRDLVAWRGLGRLGHGLLPVPLALIGVPLIFNTAAALVPFRPTLTGLAILTAAPLAPGAPLGGGGGGSRFSSSVRAQARRGHAP